MPWGRGEVAWRGWGGCVKSKLNLNSAKAEASASSLDLAELGNIIPINDYLLIQGNTKT